MLMMLDARCRYAAGGASSTLPELQSATYDVLVHEAGPFTATPQASGARDSCRRLSCCVCVWGARPLHVRHTKGLDACTSKHARHMHARGARLEAHVLPPLPQGDAQGPAPIFVALVDASRGADEEFLESVRSGLRAALEALPPPALFGLVTFSDVVGAARARPFLQQLQF